MNPQPSALPKNLWDLSTKDEIIDEIHRWRKSYASRFDYDLDRIFTNLKSEEGKDPARRSKVKLAKPVAGKP